MKIINHSLLLILFCFLLLPAIAESVVYVDSDAPSGGNGNSWSMACKNIQAGINDADILDEEVKEMIEGILLLIMEEDE